MTYNTWLSTLSERDFHAHVAGRLDAPGGLEPLRLHRRSWLALGAIALLALICGSASTVYSIILQEIK